MTKAVRLSFDTINELIQQEKSKPQESFPVTELLAKYKTTYYSSQQATASIDI